ncbi:MAG: DUF4349 domain-containing protein [Actinobacteria bacterium]|nr:MAG: DUF4349 domain-containing protein [Actinomycetota bacterium]
MLSPELASELRAARPVASPELRDRVLAVAARKEPQQRPRFSFPPLRRMALVGVAAALALAVGGALVHGITNSGSPAKRVSGASSGAPRVGGSLSGQQLSQKERARVPQVLPKVFTGSVPNTSSRLQRYGASLRVQVKNLDALSDATKRAMRFARLLGGYVASVEYGAPKNGRGGASIVVRVPVDRVQDAVEEYSGLGTILAQHVSIVDVTKAVQEEAKEIARLQADIARIEAGGVTPAERARLSAEKARLDYLTKLKATTVRRAELARVKLVLTTKPTQAAASAGRFDRTMSDAGGVLLREAEILFYVLIVAGPLLLLGAGAALLARAQRRRFERRLLEPS